MSSSYLLGDGTAVTVLTRGTETAGRHDLVEGRQPPGACTPLHLHRRYDERLWLIEGSLVVWAGRDRATLVPGDFYAIPMNVPHMLQAGPQGARALNISSPAGFAELVERAGLPAESVRSGAEPDHELFERVTAELGDVVLGPPGTLPTTGAVR